MWRMWKKPYIEFDQHVHSSTLLLSFLSSWLSQSLEQTQSTTTHHFDPQPPFRTHRYLYGPPSFIFGHCPLFPLTARSRYLKTFQWTKQFFLLWFGSNNPRKSPYRLILKSWPPFRLTSSIFNPLFNPPLLILTHQYPIAVWTVNRRFFSFFFFFFFCRSTCSLFMI